MTCSLLEEVSFSDFASSHLQYRSYHSNVWHFNHNQSLDFENWIVLSDESWQKKAKVFGSEISTAVWEVRVRITVTEASQGWPRISPWNLATWHEMDPTIFLVWVSTPTLVRMNAIKRKTETSQGRNIEKHCQVLVKLLWETVQGADCLCLCSAGAPARLFPSFNISQIRSIASCNRLVVLCSSDDILWEENWQAVFLSFSGRITFFDSSSVKFVNVNWDHPQQNVVINNCLHGLSH